MTRTNFLAFLVLLLSATIYGITEWRQTKVTSDNSIEQELTPDFIAEALKTDIYTDLGQLSHAIVAVRMEHYTSIEITHFTLPRYTLYPQNHPNKNLTDANDSSSINKNNFPWKLTAKEATLYKNNRVILNHRVHLTATDKNSLIQEIHCKYLELDLNTNIISSDQTVMIQGKDFTTYGSGLIIDLNTKQMTLTEHVLTTLQKNKN